MSLSGTLSIATGSLANINSQLALVSQNVANASTPGYAAEIATQSSLTADGKGLGVRTGVTIRNIDTTLQSELFSQNASVAGLQIQQTALQAIDAAQGTPGQGTDLASLLGKLQDQFSTLLNDPSSAPQQSQVVSTAQTLAQGINALSETYTTQRQTAEDNIAGEVSTLNATLGTIGDLSNKIVTLKASGQSTADLENQRDAALANLSQLVDVKVLQQPNGDVLLATSAGLVLPIHGTENAFSVAGANVQPGSYYPGSIPGIMLGATDVTNQLRGGQIGANIALRDSTLPTDQAELDEFAQNLAGRFDTEGLRLFTDPSGNVPAVSPPPTVQSNYVGFASTIQVNPAVQQDPSLVRDGTHQIGAAGDPNYFAPNPPGGPAGFATMITRVLTYTLGAGYPGSAGNVAWLSSTSGLGATGTLNAPYTAPSTIGGIASTMLASQAQQSATTSAQADTEQAVQTTLANKLSGQSGVNMDTEMSHMIQLQSAYGANARIITAVQAMFNQLLQAVQ
jgi:flagellar hook-associated protein 1 FlgK